LEPLIITDLADPPIAADVLLGHERVHRSQVVKQADVLMLHHLVPDETEPGSLAPNLDHYHRRTAHGSSLSPAIHASLLARAGRVDEARDFLALSCRLDLDDLTRTSSEGLHVATMGGVWQALLFGFLGVRARDQGVSIDPRLPERWRHVDVRFLFQGRRVRLGAARDELVVEADGPLPVHLPGLPPVTVTPPGARFVRRGDTWSPAEGGSP
jgi:trehalose/maltose hydrolase-like predicted phosphorylase